MTQKEQVLAYIEANGHIDAYRAFSELGILRLAACIFKLRAEGHDIVTVMRSRKTPSGIKTWAEYRMGRAVAGTTERPEGEADEAPDFASDNNTND